MVRLLGRIAVDDQRVAGLKRRLMRGVAELVDADAWAWSVMRIDVEARKPIILGAMYEGLNDRQVGALIENSEDTSTPSPEDAPMTALAMSGRHFTRTREQIVSDGDWYEHPAVNRYYLDNGIEHVMYSGYPLDEPGVVSMQGFFRVVGRAGFGSRERRIVHIITSEVDWLHGAELPADRGCTVPALSPRLRSVLMLLLEGRSRNEIADLLRISPHTVKDHTRAVYRHFGVTSQAKLVHRFRVGDGGDAGETRAI